MDFRVNITVEVDQVGNALAVKMPVPIQLVYQQGCWRAQCEKPPISTEMFDTMEEAVVAGAKEAANELQAAVDDRPVVAGKITPDQVPEGGF